MTIDGLKAVRTLSSEGIKTNVTLVFSTLQALMAAKAGATYVSPFVGRLDDLSQDGLVLVDQIVTIYDNYDYDVACRLILLSNILSKGGEALELVRIALPPSKNRSDGV